MNRHGKVLVIDDEPGVRGRLQSWLDEQGHRHKHIVKVFRQDKEGVFGCPSHPAWGALAWVEAKKR